MGRNPYGSKEGLNKGPWSASEDKILTDYIQNHGEGRWGKVPAKAGLNRCGRSCRLRWLNYLRPDIKRGNITHEEEDLIIRLHKLLGNRWSLIAGRLPGRTDNEIKNYWNTVLKKKVQEARIAPLSDRDKDRRLEVRPSPKAPLMKGPTGSLNLEKPLDIENLALDCSLLTPQDWGETNDITNFLNMEISELLGGDFEQEFMMMGGGDCNNESLYVPYEDNVLLD